MRLWQRLLQAFRAQGSAFDLTDAQAVARAFGAPSSSGKIITEESSLRVSAAWACMRIISETLGALPWHVYRRERDGTATRDDDHELAAVLCQSPNADMTSAEFREAIAMGLCQAGNAYAWKETAAGDRLVSLTPISPRDVTPMRKLGGNTVLKIPEGAFFYRVNDRGTPTDFPRERIWHIKGFGQDGLVGLSPLGAAREALGGALAMEDFANRFFSQGGMPTGTLTVPGWLTAPQREIARENLQKLMGGLGKAHQFALLEGGMKPEPWDAMNLEDLQFILGRKFSVLEICRFFRVPPHMVAELDRATFSNIEHQSLEFVTFTLMPYLTRIEASAAKWLLRPRDRASYFLRFNFEGLLRADAKGRADFYASAVQNGYMSRNEVRALENMNKVDGLDSYTAQVNLAPVDQLGKVKQPGTSGGLALLTGSGATNVEEQLAAMKAEVERVAKLPRKVIYNDAGEVIGVQIVETLH